MALLLLAATLLRWVKRTKRQKNSSTIIFKQRFLKIYYLKFAWTSPRNILSLTKNLKQTRCLHFLLFHVVMAKSCKAPSLQLDPSQGAKIQGNNLGKGNKCFVVGGGHSHKNLNAHTLIFSPKKREKNSALENLKMRKSFYFYFWRIVFQDKKNFFNFIKHFAECNFLRFNMLTSLWEKGKLIWWLIN